MPDIHLNSVKVGAVHADLPFPLNEKRPSTVSNMDELLGQVWDIGNGGFARLVRAGAANTAPAKKLFIYSDTDAFDVVQSTAAGDTIIACGVAHEGLEALDDNDFFFLINGRAGTFIKCIDSGSGVTAGDYVQPTAAGECVTDTYDGTAILLTGLCFGKVVVTAVADADVTVMLIGPMLGTIA
jgi:hypothetical protein